MSYLAQYFEDPTPSVEDEPVELTQEQQAEKIRLEEELREVGHQRQSVVDNEEVSQSEVTSLENLLPEEYPLSSFTRTPTATNLEVAIECFDKRIEELNQAITAIVPES